MFVEKPALIHCSHKMTVVTMVIGKNMAVMVITQGGGDCDYGLFSMTAMGHDGILFNGLFKVLIENLTKRPDAMRSIFLNVFSDRCW